MYLTCIFNYYSTVRAIKGTYGINRLVSYLFINGIFTTILLKSLIGFDIVIQ